MAFPTRGVSPAVASAVRTEGDSTLAMGTLAWNVADGFTKIKVLKLLIQLDSFETISQYGYETMDNENNVYEPSQIAQRRYEALSRVVTSLRQLLGNCKFTIKSENKPEFNRHIANLELISRVLNGVLRIEENMVTKEITYVINEDHFKKCFKELQKIKDEVNIILNKAGLIFRESDEVDLDKIMQEIIEGG